MIPLIMKYEIDVSFQDSITQLKVKHLVGF